MHSGNLNLHSVYFVYLTSTSIALCSVRSPTQF